VTTSDVECYKVGYLKFGEINLISSEEESHKERLFNSQSIKEIMTPNILLSDLIRQTSYNFTDFYSSCFYCFLLQSFCII